MKRLFHFILSHSLFLAICASALCLQTLQLSSLPVNYTLLAFIFFAAAGGYNVYWMVSRYTFGSHTSFTVFVNRSGSSLLVIMAGIAGMLYCFARLDLVMYNLVITFVLFCLYALPVLPFQWLRFTRNTGFLKTVLLAFTWTMVTTLVPLQISILQMGGTAQWIFINRFLFMLMLCIIFDKRDAAVDKIRGLQSLATHTHSRWLHFLMALVFITYTFTCYRMHLNGLPLLQATALLVAGISALWVYGLSLANRGYFFYYFIVDGLMFFSALITGVAGLAG